MRLEFKPLERSDWVVIALFWAFSLPFIVPSYKAPMSRTAPAVAIMMVLYTSYSILLIHGVFYTYFRRRKYLLGGLIMIVLLLVFSQLEFFVERTVLLSKTYRFNLNGILYGLIDMGTECGFLIALLSGKQFVDFQNRLLRVEKEKRESELRRLQAQIDPHFLFNNLNTLDVLIERNPAEARLYLKHLAALYRYLIRHRDEELVLFREEWAFAQDYIYLLRQRFGQGYQFEQTVEEALLDQYLIPPGALQTCIENIVKHNIGDDTAPIHASLETLPGQLRIRNTLRPKPGSSTGAGLQNLKARYALLGPYTVKVSQNGEFCVELPLIPLVSS